MFGERGKPKCWCGEDLMPVGYGQYPYECICADKHPRAMIYQGCAQGHLGWSVDLNDTGEPKAAETGKA